MTIIANNLHSLLQVFVIRLKPKEDLKKSLLDFANKNGIKAAIILTCVGSLEHYSLRFANAKTVSSLAGHFEILSLGGTLSDRACHLHMSISKTTGETIGGHVSEGNIVYTTAEIAIGVLPGLFFDRTTDNTYGYQELNVSSEKP